MEQSVNEWKPYVPICLENLYTDTIYRNEYSLYIVSRDKRKYWEILTEIYQYMRKLYGKNHPRYERRLQTILYHAEPPYTLNAKFATKEIVVWSSDPAVQEQTKQLFKNWKQLEEYYNDLLTYCRWKPEHDRQLAEAAAEQARLKEERHIKRLSNDPDHPAARKRKARRHLQRLGYDLHKSRKIAKTADDRGLYQIVKLDTGEIIAGQKFDLTLEQVEQFYMDMDFEIVEKQGCWYNDQTGFLFNREPNLEKRKEKAIKALSKMGYALEIESDTFGCGETEYYRSSCYCIRLIGNKRKVKWRAVTIHRNGELITEKYLLNGEEITFTLSEVEAFILSKS